MTEKDNEGQWTTGFEVFVPNTTEERAGIIAGRKANKITIIISLMVGVPVSADLTGTRVKVQGKPAWRVSSSRRIRYHIFGQLSLDVTKGQIARIMNRDDALSERFYHAYMGFRASQEGLHEAMIIQFYQTIEKVLPRQAAPYKALRDMVSHPEQPYQKTRRALQSSFPNDKFEFTSRGQFDYNSPHNNLLLASKAADLQKLVMSYLQRALRK